MSAEPESVSRIHKISHLQLLHLTRCHEDRRAVTVIVTYLL